MSDPGDSVWVQDLTFTVAYSTEDDEWAATCDRFPLLSWLDPSVEGAVTGLIEVLESQGLVED